MIERIHIKGYKSIKNQEIPLGMINILIGGNGVGKSNFVSVFSLVKNIYEKNLSNYVLRKGGANSFLFFGKRETEYLNLDFYFKQEENQNRYSVTLREYQESLYISKLSTAYSRSDWNGWSDQVHEEDVKESNFADFNTRQAYYVNDRLKEFDVFHFHDTSDKSPLKGKKDINDNRKFKRDGSNLASFLYYLQEKQPKHFKRIEKTIQSIAPFFDRFILQPNALNENLIQLEWREKGFPDHYHNDYSLSDGTLRFIALAVLLMQPNPPKTIIIDEPELGLHPVAINELTALIRKASKKTQIIISTQSINLVDNFEPEDILVVDRENNETVFKRLEKGSLNNWLEDYSLGDLWGKNIFGGQPLRS